MRIRVLPFARLHDLLHETEVDLDLPDDARAADAWAALERDTPSLANERRSTRIAINGHVEPFDAALTDGDEVALLPPVSGG